MQPPEMGSVVAVPQVGGCTTATNDGLPEEPESTKIRASSPWAIEVCVRTVLPLHARASANFVHQT
jgi:hypothetical protein